MSAANGSYKNLPVALLVCTALAGCGGGGAAAPAGAPPAAPPATAAATAKDQPVLIEADAGVPVSPSDPSKLQATLTAMKTTPPRPDPFALLPVEVSYERKQLAENLAAMGGTWGMLYEAPAEVETEPVTEPQPYRRLAGVLIGDSVSALLDMGNGSLVQVHPGQRIAGTEWMVQSIDSDKAILRRVGSKKLPREVVVRLESPPPGAGSGAAPPPPAGGNPTAAPGNPAPPPRRGGGKFGGGAGG
jgi:hypothetical protein